MGWHQDAAYWGLSPPDAVNLWLSLGDTTAAHGPMLHLRGSHLEPPLEVFFFLNSGSIFPTAPAAPWRGQLICPWRQHEDRYDPDSLLTRGQEIPELRGVGASDSRVIEGVLRPGECSLHHLCTAHGGGPNKAATRRVGFNVTYCAGHVESDRPEGAFGMPIAGRMPGSMVVDPAPGEETPERLVEACSPPIPTPDNPPSRVTWRTLEGLPSQDAGNGGEHHA